MVTIIISSIRMQTLPSLKMVTTASVPPLQALAGYVAMPRSAQFPASQQSGVFALLQGIKYDDDSFSLSLL